MPVPLCPVKAVSEPGAAGSSARYCYGYMLSRRIPECHFSKSFCLGTCDTLPRIFFNSKGDIWGLPALTPSINAELCLVGIRVTFVDSTPIPDILSRCYVNSRQLLFDMLMFSSSLLEIPK